MALAYHGNYCGPGWSGGRYQSSVVSSVLPVDKFDASCRAHDASYATPGSDLATADLLFAAENLKSYNPKRIAAGVAVGAQGALRAIGVLGRDNVTYPGTLSTTRKISKQGQKSLLPWEAYEQSPQGQQNEIDLMGRRNRFTAGIARKGKLGELFTKKTTTVQPSGARAIRADAINRFQSMTVTRAPAAIGNVVRNSPPTVRTSKQGVVVTGRDVVGTVGQTASTSWQLGGIFPLHPAYYNGTSMANQVRSYASYRFRSLMFHYITKQPTSVTGEVILSHRRNAIEPVEDSNSSAFISRAMSRGNATMGPIWGNLSLDVDCDLVWRNVDAFATDWADNVYGDLEAYVQSDSTTDAGYVVCDYVLELHTTIVSPHLSVIPLPTGYQGQVDIVVPLKAAKVVGGGLMATSAAINAAPQGSIWKVVIDLDLSSIDVNQVFGVVYPFTTDAATATVTYTTASTLTMVDGLTWWAVARGSGGTAVTLYSTYDAAQANSIGGSLVHASALATVANTTLYTRAYVVRFGSGELMAS